MKENRIRCCAIDDEPLALGLIVSYIKKTPFLDLIGEYNSAIQALEFIQKEQPDILFLDIQMPELNGIELSKLIPKTSKIIFTTAFSQYAIDGFKVNALDYLLKPIRFSDFLKTVERAKEWYETTHQQESSKLDFIYVKTTYKLQQIILKKILYIEGLKDYIKIYIEDEPHPIVTLLTMKKLLEKLPTTDFIRIHRSYIVRIDKIKEIERNRIIFGKNRIPISDSYKEAFYKRIEAM